MLVVQGLGKGKKFVMALSFTTLNSIEYRFCPDRLPDASLEITCNMYMPSSRLSGLYSSIALLFLLVPATKRTSGEFKFIRSGLLLPGRFRNTEKVAVSSWIRNSLSSFEVIEIVVVGD